ncbi:spinster family MFS transporter [Achromobacter ruhlandii]|uniref:Sialic acid transporter NanT n=1 Tax=Achromobacter ruhlandii TaxID=72557 RepID=A0A2M9H1N2_9BURK|nr:MFS transporter [Achromobacter ruhlandii]PJM70722.1 MFS transporter [Achromobacter ruhlandii]CAB3858878.1 Sialic acid transporter NanT [Achromobacter ruhlandii]
MLGIGKVENMDPPARDAAKMAEQGEATTVVAKACDDVQDRMDGAGAGDTAAAGPRGATHGRRGLALALLTAIYTLSFVDRQIVNILAEGIKRDLGLSDAQIGLISGLSFALLYATLGIPVARMAERRNRVRIIAVAVSVWSAFTIACGFARSVSHLFFARLGVGVGEAGSTPPSHSLIADYYPLERRASALAIYSLGIPIGTMLGAMIGGIAMHYVGWRGAFVIAGAPGLLIAAVAPFLIPEPRSARGFPVGGPSSFAFWRAARTLFAIPSFLFLVASMTLFSFYGYTSAVFSASFIFRNHGPELASWSRALTAVTSLDIGASGTLGLVFGVLPGVAGLAGTLLGGRLADRLGRARREAYVEVPAVGLLLCCAAYWASLFASTLGLVLLFTMLSFVTGSMIFGPVYATIQSIVPPTLRATASGVALLIVNLVALGTGPLIVGVISDALRPAFGDAMGLTLALCVGSSTLVFAALALWCARRSIAEDIDCAHGTGADAGMPIR